MTPPTKELWGSVMNGNMAARAKRHATIKSNLDASVEVGLQNVIEQLKSRLRIAVVFGGNKVSPDSVVYRSQNTRSWKSYEPVAEDIATSLKRSGFRNVDVVPEDMQLSDPLRPNGTHLAWLTTRGVPCRNCAAQAPSTLESLG